MRRSTANNSRRRWALPDRVSHDQAMTLDVFAHRDEADAEFSSRRGFSKRIVEVCHRINSLSREAPHRVARLHAQALKRTVRCDRFD